MREATEAFIRERLESCKVRDDDYRLVTDRLSHTLSQEQLDAFAFWLELNDEWPDTEWEHPEFVKEALREQAELPIGERGPIPLPRGFMSPEKLKTLYDFLCTAHKLESRFMEEHDGESPSEFVRTIAISMFIEENKRQPSGNGVTRMAVPRCPACSGEMHDNRDNKKNPKGPDFRCKSEDCLDANGFRTATWVRDYDATGKLKPKKKVED